MADNLDLTRAVPVGDTGVFTHPAEAGRVWYFDSVTQMPLLADAPRDPARLRAHFDGWAAWRAENG